MVRTGDFNGDGLTDLCSVGQSDDHRWLGLANTNGTFHFDFTTGYDVLDQDLSVYVSAFSGGSQLQTGDFNGDGLTDLCSIGQSEDYRWLGLSDGDGTFTFTKKYALLPSNLEFKGGEGGCVLHVGDFNGDGLTDLCSIGQSDDYRWVGLSKGNGTFEFTSGDDMLDDNENLTFYVGGEGGDQLQAGDFNGDGLTDLYAMGENGTSHRWLALSNGDGTFECTSGSSFKQAFTDYLYYSSGDYDGNGITDIIGVTVGQLYPGYGWTGLNGNEAARLTKVTQGFQTETTHGVVTEIEYRPLTDPDIYVKGSGAEYPIRDMISPMHVVSTLTKDNGQGGSYDTDYTYRAARQHLHGRGFLGFLLPTKLTS